MKSMKALCTIVLWVAVSSDIARGHQIESYAALGDSYAAGDGAGSSKLLPRFDSGCGRFSEAYPVQLTNSSNLDIDDGAFQNIACGGSTSARVLRTQIPRISNSDLVTITVVGNEVDFFVVLNECIQQWRPFSSCEGELARARGLIQSTTFIDNFDRIVAGAVKALKPGAILMVTGYARFFNDETTQCDHITFSKTNPDNFLTQELRKKFNQLVDMLNDVITAAASAHGAVYLDMDAVFRGHRFCEEDVAKPDPGRVDTWFFNGHLDSTALQGHGSSNQEDLFASLSPNPFKDFVDLTRTFSSDS